jgi:heat-inducible transcriptional repressor
MATLEEKGYIYQPHTSAGRVPTTLGYRFYVDNMMRMGHISSEQKNTIQMAVFQNTVDFETVLKEAAKILSQLCSQLGVIISPQFDNGIFHHMDINRLNSERLLLILSINSGMVKTIFLEVNSDIKSDYLNSLCDILNERLSGLKLKEIRLKFSEIVEDIPDDNQGLLPIFVKTAHRIFDFSEENEVYLNGTHNILRQPEFSDNLKFSGVVELLENKKIMVHLFEEKNFTENWTIQIGEEIKINNMQDCSIISAKYKINYMEGILGVIGPMRMDYSHLIPLVKYTAKFLSHSFEKN